MSDFNFKLFAIVVAAFAVG